jgi:hypothetical protein
MSYSSLQRHQLYRRCSYPRHSTNNIPIRKTPLRYAKRSAEIEQEIAQFIEYDNNVDEYNAICKYGSLRKRERKGAEIAAKIDALVLDREVMMRDI